MGKYMPLLAGHSMPRGDYLSEKRGPVFEVLDPGLFPNKWRALPRPPFIDLYNRFSYGPKICRHTVIGKNIYMHVSGSSGRTVFYSFNVESNQWMTHSNGVVSRCMPFVPEIQHSRVNSGSSTDSESYADSGSSTDSESYADYGSSSLDSGSSAGSGSDEAILTNLDMADWNGGADVVDYLLYQVAFDVPEKCMKVFAYDLTALKEDELEETKTLPDDNSVSSSESESDDVVIVPVYCLNTVTDTIPCRTSSSNFVIHISGNMFCLVSYYTRFPTKKKRDPTKEDEGPRYPPLKAAGRTYHVRACLFEVVSVELSEGSEFRRRYLVAKNPTMLDKSIDGDFGSFQTWCKIPNTGTQKFFRRPQFPLEGKPNWYQDNVAGDKVTRGQSIAVRRVDYCTCDSGVQNIHVLREGWTWLARFLNTLPADSNIARALQAFLDLVCMLSRLWRRT